MHTMLRRSKLPIPKILLLCLAAFAGGMVVATPLLAGRFDPYHKLSVFAKVLAYIENNYVEDVDEKTLMFGAARGLTDALDPHSRFMDPEEYDRLRKDTEGNNEITGIGIDIEKRKTGLVVVSCIDGTPAARAGIEPGDILLRVDGEDVNSFSWEGNDEPLSGQIGSEVLLTFRRRTREITFRILREKFEVKTVEWRLWEPGYASIKVRNFSSNTDDKVLEALESIKKQSVSVGGIKGLVMDLRHNPGGLLDQAVRVADRFIAEGMIVRTVGKAGKEMDRQMAHSRGTWLGFPMVALVDGASASAAEIVAGALQDHERAVIIGTPTFGKGSVQTVLNIDGCGPRPCGLKLTISRYYTPNGRSIQSQGIAPNILVEPNSVATEDSEADLVKERNFDRRLRNEQGEKAADKKRTSDHQLQVALDYLKSWAVFSKQSDKKG